MAKALSLALVLMLTEQVVACPVCMPLPRQTIADLLIEAEVVVFGREDSEQRFSFLATKVLKGKLTEPHIELFADSATRRQLAADENRSALLVKSGNVWRNLGVADDEYQQIVRRILVFAPEWMGAEGQQRRVEYFLSLWNHKNRAIFELAYLELGKAPYSSIRKFGASVSFEELQPLLTDRDYLEWRSLAILMIAPGDDESARQIIVRQFENCAKFSLTMNLTAWATAYIEIVGPAAVAVIEREYLKNAARSESEIQSVLTALSVHARLDNLGLRDRIIASYGSVLSVHPKQANRVARDLTDWQRDDYREEIRKIFTKSEFQLDNVDVAVYRHYTDISRDTANAPD